MPDTRALGALAVVLALASLAFALFDLSPVQALICGGVSLVGLGLGGNLSRRRRLRERWRARLLKPHPGGADEHLGKVMGGYLVCELLGRGGMGTVYRGVPVNSLDLGKAVAIKVMSAQMASDPAFLRRFQREIEILRRLAHPHIVTLLASGEEGGHVYLVTELLVGRTLRQSLPARGLPWQDALELLLPALEGLHFAHEQGVIHRDLKPDNLFLVDHGPLKIMDFGLARAQNLNLSGSGETNLGTPAYMSPEQVAGGVLTPACDQYALGVILFEMLTGRVPFEDDDPVNVVNLHLSETPPSPRQYAPDLPAALENLILKLLAKDPAQRFADCRAVVRALGQLLHQSSVFTPGPGPYSDLTPIGPQSFRARHGGDRVCLKKVQSCLDSPSWLEAHRSRVSEWNAQWHCGEAGIFVSRPWVDGLPLSGHRSEAMRLLEPLLTALEALHSQGLCHLNLKPSNLYWVGGKIVLVDPWLADLTRVDPVYQAPEQMSGPGCPATDQYAAGAIFYYLLTGEEWTGAMGDHDLGAWGPPLTRMLRPQPAQRYASAAMALAGLQGSLAGRPRKKQSTLVKRRPKPVPVEG